MAYIFVTTKEKTNWKYLLIIVILALIVIGETFYLIKQEVSVPSPKPIPSKQTQDETANWKTYRNEEYGFEVRYPEVWDAVIGERFLPMKERVGFGPIQPEPFSLIYVTVMDNSEHLSLRDFYTDEDIIYEFCGKDSYIVPFCWFPFEELQQVEKVIAGIKSLQFEEGIPDLAPIVRFTFIPKGDFIFEIVQVKSTKYSLTELERIYNQMLSTFRFLE